MFAAMLGPNAIGAVFSFASIVPFPFASNASRNEPPVAPAIFTVCTSSRGVSVDATRSGTTWLSASFTLPDRTSRSERARRSPMPTQLNGRAIV